MDTSHAAGWLRGRRFDLALLLGVPACALLIGGAGAIRPEYFAWALAFDLWFVSFPHNAATLTRVAFSRADAREHCALLFALPFAALIASVSILRVGGVVALNTVYFFWQSFHYARQSYGIDRAYRRAAGGDALAPDALGAAVVYLFPLWGVLRRCAQQPATFFGMPVALPAVSPAVALFAGALAVLALGAFVARAGVRSPRALFLLTHAGVFTVGYILVEEPTRGWLVVNVWHNAQYLLFVWAQNQRRFRDARDPERPWLSWLSRREHALGYAAACVALSTAFYAVLITTSRALDPRGALAVLLVCSQAVNFHHYVVDAVIWRSRRAGHARISAARPRPDPSLQG